MKQNKILFKKTLLFFALFIGGVLPNCLAQTFNFQTWNSSNESTLTVTAFRSVTIDKRGIVWVGSELGGLYNFKDSIWKKIGVLPNISFRQLVPSNIVGDSNVWAASNGSNGVQATGGGAYFINTLAETGTLYGISSGGLSSNFANSLALSSQGKVYMALSTQVNGSTTRQGGVFVANSQNPPPPPATIFSRAISDAGDILYHSAGNRGDELWFGRGGRCQNGVCQAAYIARINSSGAIISSITNANSPLPFTNSATSAFARAIFTDTITGNTFVGMSTGGIGILKPDNSWKMLTSSNSPLPAGAAVNFNAISEVFGEIWVGTTAGVFVYNGYGSLDSASSFKMLTTANGLPADNITDIAVDPARTEIWLTSFAGVSRCKYAPPFISGFVFDVFVNKSTVKLDSVPDLYPTLQKTPLTTGVEVRLYRNGSLVDSATTNEVGRFALTHAVNGELYDLSVTYISPNRFLHNMYENIRNDTFMGNILLPDKLMNEITDFKKNAASRRFDISLPFNITFKTSRVDGFNVTDYNKSYEQFIDPFGIKNNHKTKVENLADFYCAMAGVYHLGGSSTELMNKSIESAWEFIQSILENVKLLSAAKKSRPEIAFKFFIDILKLRKETEFLQFKKLIVNNTSPETKKNLDKMLSFMSDFVDLALDVLKNADNLGELRQDIALDLTKRLVAAKLASFYYYNYCNIRHQNFVSTAANGANDARSQNTYENTFNRVYNPAGSSLVKLSLDNLDAKKTIIENSNTVAKFAGLTSSILDAASLLRLIPGGQLAGLAVKGVALAAKVVKVAAHANAMLAGADGSFQIAQSSNDVLPYSGLSARMATVAGIARTQRTASQQSLNDLSTLKDIYNQKLVQLKVFYNTTPYDSVAFFSQFNNFGAADSAYSDELRKTTNRLFASTDSAVLYVPGFSAKLNKVVDSFMSKQYTFRDAFFYQNLGYSFDSDKSPYLPDLNSLADSIIAMNDSAYNGLTALIDDINSNTIPAPANLVQDSYQLNHSRNLGDTGSVTYVFTNYGSEPQQNVSFKISPITAGYQLNGTDSIHTGTINPGQSVTVSFAFKAPFSDSSGSYLVTVKANNGKYQDVSGTLNVYDPNKFYSVKDGNWSNPETWINEAVPTSTSHVVINHQVTVDVDASCKAVTATIPGKITVSAGKHLTVLQ